LKIEKPEVPRGVCYGGLQDGAEFALVPASEPGGDPPFARRVVIHKETYVWHETMSRRLRREVFVHQRIEAWKVE
jgi:hypothetical protein